LKIVTLWFLLAGCVTAGHVRADGIPFRGNRIDGPATVLKLTVDQRKAVRHRGPVIALNKDQQALLLRRAGYAPKSLAVERLAWAKQTCSCEVLNIGVAYAPGKIEVPHAYLGKDLYDRGNHMRARDKT
jgi:hypothetical protein